MSVLGELLAACVAAPADDAPRTVWADAIGGDRGELVAVQLRLARGASLAADEHAALRDRERALLAAHGPTWAGLAAFPDITRATFRRGFVEAIEIDAAAFATHADAIIATAPFIRELAVTGLLGEHMDEVQVRRATAIVPAVAAHGITGLVLGPCGARPVVPGRAAGFDSSLPFTLHALAQAGALEELRTLGAQGFDSIAATELLAAPARIADLARLSLSYDASELGAVRALLHHLPRLRAFSFHANHDPALLVADLPAGCALQHRAQAAGEPDAASVALR